MFSLSPLSPHPPRAHVIFLPACFTTSELYSSDHLHSPLSTPTGPLSARQFSTNLLIAFPPPTYGINCFQDSWASTDCFNNVEQITITKIYRDQDQLSDISVTPHTSVTLYIPQYGYHDECATPFSLPSHHPSFFHTSNSGRSAIRWGSSGRQGAPVYR